MDTFTLVIFLLLIMIAISQEVTWAAAGLIVLLVFAMRHAGLIIMVLVGLLLGYMFSVEAQVMWVLVAVIIVAIVLFEQGGRGPEAYSPEYLMGGG